MEPEPTRPAADRHRRRDGARQARILSLALTVLGAVAVFPPLAGIAWGDQSWLGLPPDWLYLFVVWVLLILGAATVARRLPDDATGDDGETGGAD